MSLRTQSQAQKNLPAIILTGANSGIGASILNLLEKYSEFLNYRWIALIKPGTKPCSHENVESVFCDLENPKEIDEFCRKYSKLSIYALINNAGIYPFGTLSDTLDSDWQRTLQVNLTAPFQLSRGLLSGLQKCGKNQGARIINLSSTAGILPNHFALSYSVSKAGLIQLSKTLAKELGPEGITVNAICPGIVKTPMHEAYHKTERELESFYAKRGASFPMRRMGEPEDIAHAVFFLLSKKSSWITGEVMVIDGGRLLL